MRKIRLAGYPTSLLTRQFYVSTEKQFETYYAHPSPKNPYSRDGNQVQAFHIEYFLILKFIGNFAFAGTPLPSFVPAFRSPARFRLVFQQVWLDKENGRLAQLTLQGTNRGKWPLMRCEKGINEALPEWEQLPLLPHAAIPALALKTLPSDFGMALSFPVEEQVAIASNG